MRKSLLVFTISFLFNYCYSQTRIGTKGIDSIENVINQTFKSNKYFIDSGKLYNKDSSKIIGSFKKAFFINKTTGNLDLAQYEQRLNTKTSIFESFYYSDNKPMTAYRITVIPKNIKPEIRFLITSNTYLWEGNKLTLSADRIKQTALKLLKESKDYQ
jgi:hypothetical protein